TPHPSHNEATMSDEKTDQPAAIVNGGEPTDKEALLAAQVDTIGTDPQVDPNDAAAVAAQAAAAAAAKTPAAAPAAVDPSAAVPAPAPAASPAATDPTAVVASPAPAPVAAPAPVGVPAQAKPEAPKDFDAEYAALQTRYDAGDLDGDQLQQAQRALSREEGAFTARVTLWEERQNFAVQQAAADFNATALSWEGQNKDFMSNSLRRNAMQQAVLTIDKETGGTLSPTDLFARAQKDAFDAFGYTPPTAQASDPNASGAAAVAAAVAARQPAAVPATLATAPAAAPIEAGRNSTFADLDSKDIGALEDALARMTPAQRDAYLSDAPGATSLATSKV
ncbi:MAG: hypothetical protein WA777_12725, partial [Rhodanobacter sp.]